MMKFERPRFRILSVVACGIVLVLGDVSNVIAQIKTPVLFDLGTSTSPIAESAIRVTGESRYESRTAFGWVTTGQASFDRDKPLPELRHGGNPMRPDLLYRSHANRLNRDGLACSVGISGSGMQRQDDCNRC